MFGILFMGRYHVKVWQFVSVILLSCSIKKYFIYPAFAVFICHNTVAVVRRGSGSWRSLTAAMQTLFFNDWMEQSSKAGRSRYLSRTLSLSLTVTQCYNSKQTSHCADFLLNDRYEYSKQNSGLCNWLFCIQFFLLFLLFPLVWLDVEGDALIASVNVRNV